MFHICERERERERDGLVVDDGRLADVTASGRCHSFNYGRLHSLMCTYIEQIDVMRSVRSSVFRLDGAPSNVH